jgi:hypothetical protein
MMTFLNKRGLQESKATMVKMKMDQLPPWQDQPFFSFQNYFDCVLQLGFAKQVERTLTGQYDAIIRCPGRTFCGRGDSRDKAQAAAAEYALRALAKDSELLRSYATMAVVKHIKTCFHEIRRKLHTDAHSALFYCFSCWLLNRTLNWTPSVKELSCKVTLQISGFKESFEDEGMDFEEVSLSDKETSRLAERHFVPEIVDNPFVRGIIKNTYSSIPRADCRDPEEALVAFLKAIHKDFEIEIKNGQVLLPGSDIWACGSSRIDALREALAYLLEDDCRATGIILDKFIDLEYSSAKSALPKTQTLLSNPVTGDAFLALILIFEFLELPFEHEYKRDKRSWNCIITLPGVPQFSATVVLNCEQDAQLRAKLYNSSTVPITVEF